MKKVTFILLLTLLTFISFAQENPTIDSLRTQLKIFERLKTEAEDQIAFVNKEIVRLSPPIVWKKGGFIGANFNQILFDNWAAGGVNAVSVTTLANYYANYKKDKSSWNTNLDLAYGMIQNKDQKPRKNEDKIDLLSKYGYTSPIKHVDYAALVNFKSQFAPSYTYNEKNEQSPMISTFLAPAFVLASLGLDYKPKPYFSVYLSPATGKFTIVNVNDNAIKKAFAVDSNKTIRSEFGAYMNVFFQKDITKTINLLSRLALFNNYTDKNIANRKNIDVNFENMVNAKLSKYLTANLFVNWIYDNDIEIKYDENDPTRVGPRLQFKEVFGIGLSYKF